MRLFRLKVSGNMLVVVNCKCVVKVASIFIIKLT